MTIDNEIIKSYFNCSYKAFLKINNKAGLKSSFESFHFRQKEKSLEKYNKSYSFQFNCHNKLITVQELQLGYDSISNGVLSCQNLLLEFDFLEKVDEESNLGCYSYIPIILLPRAKAYKEDKAILAFLCFTLGQIQGKYPKYGKIVFNGEVVTRIKYKYDQNWYQENIEAITTLQYRKPDLLINKHCHICEFQASCRERALNSDNLSLIGGISQKDIKRLNNKGIFTITQLSYTFHPRRKRKRPENYVRPHSFELQALALRENKIFIHETPRLPNSEVELYYDIEGIPEKGFQYLIGLLVKKGTQEDFYSFWANNKEDEPEMFQSFLKIVEKYKGCTYFHYGNYEIKELKRIEKDLKDNYKSTLSTLVKHSVNVLSIISTHIYFPTYNNSLKEIAKFLQFEWHDKESSGLQSIMWRLMWEENNDELTKQKLIQYNKDDCFALLEITTFIQKLFSNKDQTISKVGDVLIEVKKDININKLYKRKSAINEIELIKKHSYFDYQRERVFARANPVLKKAVKQQKKRVDIKKAKINKVIEIYESICPNCGIENITIERKLHKNIVDLKFFKSGVNKLVIQYKSAFYKCNNCKWSFIPMQYIPLKGSGSIYGHNLKIWVIFQHFANRQSFAQITSTLAEIFNIHPSKNHIFRFKKYFSDFYEKAYENVKSRVIHSKVLYVDETPVNLKFESGYVWVFTTNEEVISIYKPTREGEFLKEFLKDFNGVLVTDFYAAYDSLPCKQQKCLLHLIRNINDDLLKNPFDEEFKEVAKRFTILLQTIVATVDKFGLKHRNLNKHIRDVEKFYKYLEKEAFKSEVSIYYQNRFIRNKEKLFELLNQDNVSWNNNNAEHAIKTLATHYNRSLTSFRSSTIPDYLKIMSLYQTCEFKKISFLKFLLSQSKDIEHYYNNLYIRIK